MNSELLHASIQTIAVFSFSRSGGPGGQNVNKVNSKSTIRIDLTLLEGITEEERLRLLSKLSSRLVDTSVLQIQVQDERSQLLNRGIALERAFTVILNGLHRDRPRKATKPTKASKERRLTSKRLSSLNKRNRTKPPQGD